MNSSCSLLRLEFGLFHDPFVVLGIPGALLFYLALLLSLSDDRSSLFTCLVFIYFVSFSLSLLCVLFKPVVGCVSFCGWQSKGGV